MPRTTKEVKEKKNNLTSNTKTNSKPKTTASKSKKSGTSKTTKKVSSNVSSKSKVKKVSTSSKKTPNKTVKTKKQSINILEYYDLPYRYNETTVKILAQTPKTLFVYWDISDDDRNNFISNYGKDFFEKTKPVLIIHNVTMNYTFEIEINDFANCWYFNINDEKCEYSVELGRRPKMAEINIPNNYLYITSSNKIESPNGHILFEKEQNTIFYRNVKTNETYSKNIANLDFIKRIGKIYNIYDMYKKIYQEDEFLEINNPSSL